MPNLDGLNPDNLNPDNLNLDNLNLENLNHDNLNHDNLNHENLNKLLDDITAFSIAETVKTFIGFSTCITGVAIIAQPLDGIYTFLQGSSIHWVIVAYCFMVGVWVLRSKPRTMASRTSLFFAAVLFATIAITFAYIGDYIQVALHATSFVFVISHMPKS